MKTRAVLPLLAVATILLLGASTTPAYPHDKHHDDNCVNYTDVWLDGSKTNIDVDDGVIRITHRDRREGRSTVEINDRHELFVNGDRIELNDSQQKLVTKFHGQMIEINREARAIGKEAAKIGIKGAKLGLSALGKTMKLISSNYDSDDLEREMELEAEKIEKEAERLEDWAEEIEDLADEMEETAHRMHEEIPALNNLRWFDR